MANAYTGEEVAKHNQEKDLWIVMDNNVYDLTKFLKEHPGGEEVLVNLAGQDGTKCFNEIGHTQEAVQLREGFKIGILKGSLTDSTAGRSGSTGGTIDDDDWEYEEPKSETSPWLPTMVACAVAIYAVIFYYLWYS